MWLWLYTIFAVLVLIGVVLMFIECEFNPKYAKMSWCGKIGFPMTFTAGILILACNIFLIIDVLG